MKLIKSVVSAIWGIYGATILILTFVFMLTVYKITLFLKGENDKTLRFLLHFNTKFVSIVLFHILLIRLKVIGREKIKDRPYVIVSNHLSTLDIIVNGVAFPHTFRFLSKVENSKAPILGPIVKTVCLIVDRTSRSGTLKSMKQMIATLKKDKMSLLIYPEGTRKRTDEPLQEFHDGAFHLAIKTQTPIAVQTIVGSDTLYPATRLIYLLPGMIYAYWDEPIETKGMTLEDLPRLKEMVRNKMLNNIEKHASHQWMLKIS